MAEKLKVGTLISGGGTNLRGALMRKLFLPDQTLTG